MRGGFSAPGDYIYFKSQVPLHKIPVSFFPIFFLLIFFPPFLIEVCLFDLIFVNSIWSFFLLFWWSLFFLCYCLVRFGGNYLLWNCNLFLIFYMHLPLFTISFLFLKSVLLIVWGSCFQGRFHICLLQFLEIRSFNSF